MNRATRVKLNKGALLFVIGIIASLGFMRFLRGQPEIEGGDVLTAVIVGLFMSSAQLAIEGAVLPRTRQMPLILAVLIRAVCYTLGVVGAVLLGISVANFLYGGIDRASVYGFWRAGWGSVQEEWSESLPTGMFLSASIYALLVVLVLVFIGSIAQKLGPGVLLNWLVGRYHKPRKEQCVFLFLDLKGSTSLAEQLGDLRFSALIRDTFFDMTPALLEHGANVSHFIGDEVVLYWTIRKGGRPSPEFARCFFAVQDLLQRLAPKYRERYGHVPEFKAGAHWGSVIATDVGQIKSEIVFHGDVLNVASRLEGLCGAEGASFIVSGELASVLIGEEGFVVEDLGERQLRGRESTLNVASVRRDPRPKPSRKASSR